MHPNLPFTAPVAAAALVAAAFQSLVILQLAAAYGMFAPASPSHGLINRDRGGGPAVPPWPPSGREMSGWAMAASGVTE
jgi:hypothetical protein